MLQFQTRDAIERIYVSHSLCSQCSDDVDVDLCLRMRYSKVSLF